MTEIILSLAVGGTAGLACGIAVGLWLGRRLGKRRTVSTADSFLKLLKH